MAKQTYAEKLKDPRWQKKRLMIFERDGFTCRNCQSKKKTLHVHHLWYVGGNPWDAPMDALITLCGDCHGAELKRGEVEKRLIDGLVRSGWSVDQLEFLTDCLISIGKFSNESKSLFLDVLNTLPSLECLESLIEHLYKDINDDREVITNEFGCNETIHFQNKQY